MELRLKRCYTLTRVIKNSDAGHIKCSSGLQVPHPALPTPALSMYITELPVTAKEDIKQQ